MKKNMMVLLLVFIGIIASIIIIGQRRDSEEAVPANQVDEAIKTFTALLNEQNMQSFGLKNAEELKALKQGKQYRKYMIGLKDLKMYKEGDDVDSIIKALPVIEVTLTGKDGEIITSIEFTKEGNKWKASGFGLTPELINLRDTQPLLDDSLGGNAHNGMLITVPALHTSFIAVAGTSGPDFIVLEDNQNLGYKRGERIPASDALTKLRQVAALYNGLPD